MKITITFLGVMLSVLLHAQTQNKNFNSQTTFGRYGSDCSSGRGACSFTVSKLDHADSFTTSKKISETSFLVAIARKGLTPSEEIKIAGRPFAELSSRDVVSFVQQDDLYLNEMTLKNLQIDPRHRKISAGNYPMAISDDTIEVVFTLESE